MQNALVYMKTFSTEASEKQNWFLKRAEAAPQQGAAWEHGTASRGAPRVNTWASPLLCSPYTVPNIPFGVRLQNTILTRPYLQGNCTSYEKIDPLTCTGR